MTNFLAKYFSLTCLSLTILVGGCGVADENNYTEDLEYRFMDWGETYNSVHNEIHSDALFNDVEKEHFANVEIIKLKKLQVEFEDAQWDDVEHFDFPFKRYGLAKRNRVFLTSEILRAINIGLIKYGRGGRLDNDGKGLYVIVLTELFKQLPDADKMIEYLNEATLFKPFKGLAQNFKNWEKQFEKDYDRTKKIAENTDHPELMLRFLKRELKNIAKFEQKTKRAKKLGIKKFQYNNGKKISLKEFGFLLEDMKVEINDAIIFWNSIP